MARLPPPPTPATLRSVFRPTEDVGAVHTATRLVRIFTARGAHPQQWNSFRTTGPLPHARFDPQPPTPTGGLTDDGPGVLYFALTVRTCVAEVYQSTSIVDRSTRAPYLVVLRPRRTLRLLDLTGLWPTRAGASQLLNNSTGKTLTQAWARAIRAAHPELDGLWHRSSMDSGAPQLCLWAPPAGDALPETPDVLLPLNNPGLDVPLARICAELNYTVLG